MKMGFLGISKQQREQRFLFLPSIIRYWSPEDEVLWFRGTGAEQAPAPSTFILENVTVKILKYQKQWTF